MFSDFKSKALDRCYANKSALTPQRLLVLESVYGCEKPISAYDLQQHIINVGVNLNISTVYRILNFWSRLNLIHRISAINKFACCVDPDEQHIHIINCCKKCESLVETCNKVMGFSVNSGMKKLGLNMVENSHIEIAVICPGCA